VEEAGFASAVMTEVGLNTIHAAKFRIRRLSFEPGIEFQYGAELLAGLHV
jgi:hypothetical protein